MHVSGTGHEEGSIEDRIRRERRGGLGALFTRETSLSLSLSRDSFLLLRVLPPRPRVSKHAHLHWRHWLRGGRVAVFGMQCPGGPDVTDHSGIRTNCLRFDQGGRAGERDGFLFPFPAGRLRPGLSLPVSPYTRELVAENAERLGLGLLKGVSIRERERECVWVCGCWCQGVLDLCMWADELDGEGGTFAMRQWEGTGEDDVLRVVPVRVPVSQCFNGQSGTNIHHIHPLPWDDSLYVGRYLYYG